MRVELSGWRHCPPPSARHPRSALRGTSDRPRASARAGLGRPAAAPRALCPASARAPHTGNATRRSPHRPDSRSCEIRTGGGNPRSGRRSTARCRAARDAAPRSGISFASSSNVARGLPRNAPARIRRRHDSAAPADSAHDDAPCTRTTEPRTQNQHPEPQNPEPRTASSQIHRDQRVVVANIQDAVGKRRIGAHGGRQEPALSRSAERISATPRRAPARPTRARSAADCRRASRCPRRTGRCSTALFRSADRRRGTRDRTPDGRGIHRGRPSWRTLVA